MRGSIKVNGETPDTGSKHDSFSATRPPPTPPPVRDDECGGGKASPLAEVSVAAESPQELSLSGVGSCPCVRISPIYLIDRSRDFQK